jgi:hypothetical protein
MEMVELSVVPVGAHPDALRDGCMMEKTSDYKFFLSFTLVSLETRKGSYVTL